MCYRFTHIPTSTNVLPFHSYTHIHECATVSLIYPHPRMCYCFTHIPTSTNVLPFHSYTHIRYYCFHRLLDWRERKAKAATNEHKTKYDKIVIVSHAFHPSEFEVRFNPFLTLSFDLLDTNFNFFPVLTFGHQFQVVDPLSTLFTVFPVLTLWAPNSSNLTPYPL